jgi:hypothetical protein
MVLRSESLVSQAVPLTSVGSWSARVREERDTSPLADVTAIPVLSTAVDLRERAVHVVAVRLCGAATAAFGPQQLPSVSGISAGPDGEVVHVVWPGGHCTDLLVPRT